MTTDYEHELNNGVDSSFPMHRKLLRRRHVRKLQKTKERARQQREEEEKQRKIARDRDRQGRFENKQDVHDKRNLYNIRSSARCALHSMGNIKAGNLTASPTPIGSAEIRAENKKMGNNTMANCISSPTSVLGFQRMAPTESLAPISNVHRKIRNGSNCDMTSTKEFARYKEVEVRCRSSFSLPGFSPVRPTKFRKLQL